MKYTKAEVKEYLIKEEKNYRILDNYLDQVRNVIKDMDGKSTPRGFLII